MNINLRIEVAHNTMDWESICRILRAGVTIKYAAMFLVRSNKIYEVHDFHTLNDNKTCVFAYVDTGEVDTGLPTDTFLCLGLKYENNVHGDDYLEWTFEDEDEEEDEEDEEEDED